MARASSDARAALCLVALLAMSSLMSFQAAGRNIGKLLLRPLKTSVDLCLRHTMSLKANGVWPSSCTGTTGADPTTNCIHALGCAPPPPGKPDIDIFCRAYCYQRGYDLLKSYCKPDGGGTCCCVKP
ncbi:hypothetical protein CFC21_082491 [Triticum aestivum]|uniref:Uncharacterized protein n=2 Tax=Triticum aestivum TaxID=4565 RepID=A0A9R1I5J5_WHEAT|nr:hypothetical protein CFC21_082491 [Triticum aestivum]